MKRSPAWSKGPLALAALLAVLVSPSAGGATELLLQATASKQGPGSASSPIDVFVLATQRGTPVSDLGQDVGNGTSPITLPTGWTLTLFPSDGIVGCAPEPLGPAVFPSRFTNHGNGVYAIKVQIHADCQWNAFVLYYAVQVDIGTLRGSALGQFFPLSGP